MKLLVFVLNKEVPLFADFREFMRGNKPYNKTPIRQCLVKNISVSLIQKVIARMVKKRRLPGFLFGWNFTYRGFGVTFREF